MENENDINKGFWKRKKIKLNNKEYGFTEEKIRFDYYFFNKEESVIFLEFGYNFLGNEDLEYSDIGEFKNSPELFNIFKRKFLSLNVLSGGINYCFDYVDVLSKIIKRHNEGIQLTADELVILYNLPIKNDFSIYGFSFSKKNVMYVRESTSWDVFGCRVIYENEIKKICSKRNHKEDFELLPMQYRSSFLRKYGDFDVDVKFSDHNFIIECGDLKYASDELLGDSKFIYNFMEENPNYFILPYTKNNINCNKKLMLEHFKNIVSLERDDLLLYVGDNLKNDGDIVRFAIKINGNCIKYASDRLKNNRDIVILALLFGCEPKEENFPLSMLDKYPEIKKIVDIVDIINLYATIKDDEVKRVLSNNIINLIKHSPPEIKTSYRIMKKAFIMNPETINFANPRVQNKLRGR